MTDTVTEAPAEPAAPRPDRLRVGLVAVIAVVTLVIAVAAGFIWGRSGSSGQASGAAPAVDVGFSQDMSAHHEQAIVMATYAYDHSDDPAIRSLAYDIESSQTTQLGLMTGWLQAWHAAQHDPMPMSWMPGHQMVMDGLMPGMATPAQMARLQTLDGKALDVLFLQLMLHHHQGGLPMAEYASTHATTDYVRALADNMYVNQSREITQMEQLLRQRGAAPLPPPQ